MVSHVPQVACVACALALLAAGCERDAARPVGAKSEPATATRLPATAATPPGPDCRGCATHVYKMQASGCFRLDRPAGQAVPTAIPHDVARCPPACCPGLEDCSGCAERGHGCLDATERFVCGPGCCAR
jgi:hypothetical protein